MSNMYEGKQTSYTASHKIYILATLHELIVICDDLEKQRPKQTQQWNSLQQLEVISSAGLSPSNR